MVRADWTSFERQVGELGMLIMALGQTETRVAEFLGQERFNIQHPLCFEARYDLRFSYG